jgi:hypothetical protein
MAMIPEPEFEGLCHPATRESATSARQGEAAPVRDIDDGPLTGTRARPDDGRLFQAPCEFFGGCPKEDAFVSTPVEM